MDMPMLDEEEFRRFFECHRASMASYRQHSKKVNNLSIGTRPFEEMFQSALDLYETMTGYKETNINAIYHHRLALYGAPCPVCQKPLRTPRAKLCVLCGWKKDHAVTPLKTNQCSSDHA
jgi:hypothetical protein